MVAVATGVHRAIESIESRVFKENLQNEMESFKQGYQKNVDQPLPRSASMTAYLIAPGEESGLPDYIRDLKDGTYEIEHDRKFLQIAIEQVNGKKLALVLDATLFEQRENSITNTLILAVVIASLLSLWLGFALSQKAISPVTNLARDVAVLEPGKTANKLATRYDNDEVGELAMAFDRYLERLQEFIAREHEFTGNASHELRTPLTIIKGAAELLDTDTELSASSRKVLQRIKRAVDNMSQVVETLLVLAREEEITEHSVSRASDIAQAIISESNDLPGKKSIRLEMHSKQDFELPVPRSILTILLSNLLRNAIAHTREGSITITIESPYILVADTGKGISTEALPLIFDRHYRDSSGELGSGNHSLDNAQEPSGSGIGLSIVKRICDHYHWQIDVNSTVDKGTIVSVNFEESLKILA
jgi:hypothetical protein